MRKLRTILDLLSKKVLHPYSVLICKCLLKLEPVLLYPEQPRAFSLNYFFIFLLLPFLKLLNFCSKTAFRWVETFFFFLERNLKKKKKSGTTQHRLPLNFNNIYTLKKNPQQGGFCLLFLEVHFFFFFLESIKLYIA